MSRSILLNIFTQQNEAYPDFDKACVGWVKITAELDSKEVKFPCKHYKKGAWLTLASRADVVAVLPTGYHGYGKSQS